MAPVGSPVASLVALSQASAKQVVLVNVPLLQATVIMKGSILLLTRSLTSPLLNPVVPQEVVEPCPQ